MSAVKLSDEQEAVMRDIIDGQNVLVTGSAGTGKSTILRELNARFKGKLQIAGSTGIAAVNVGGSTIHSWAGLGLGEDPAETIADRLFAQRSKPYKNIFHSPRLAIDEVSMIHGDLFETMETLFRLIRESSKPFGGMQMILFGDFLQLPPVSRGKDMRFAFQTQAWSDAKFRVHCLRKVYRQADATFSDALNQIRMGELTPEVRQLLSRRLGAIDPNPEVEPVVVFTHNQDVDSTNERRLAQIEGKEYVYHARDWGQDGPLKMLQKNCLAPATLRLKVGAQVMLLQNIDPEAGLANGSIGTVESFMCEMPFVRFNNGEGIQVERHSWSIRAGDEVTAERTQLPLRLAWSITAHKSQGMTLDKVAVHLDRAFDYGQSYVALSRARTLEGLFIRSSKFGCIKAHPDAVKFYEDAGK